MHSNAILSKGQQPRPLATLAKVIDPEVVRLLSEAKKTPTRRRAAEVLGRLQGQAMEVADA